MFASVRLSYNYERGVYTSLCITLQLRIARPNERRSPVANLLKPHKSWHSPWNGGVQQEVWHMVCRWSCSMFFGIWTSVPALRERPEPLSQSQFPSWHRTPVRHTQQLTQCMAADVCPPSSAVSFYRRLGPVRRSDVQMAGSCSSR